MGYPGYIFLQKIRYGYGAQRYDEKRIILHNWYSALRAYLPMMYHVYDKDESRYKNDKEFWKTELVQRLKEAGEKIEEARRAYNPVFENQSCGNDEKDFQTILEGIEERLDDITAMTKIIDKARHDEETDMVAG